MAKAVDKISSQIDWKLNRKQVMLFKNLTWLPYTSAGQPSRAGPGCGGGWWGSECGRALLAFSGLCLSGERSLSPPFTSSGRQESVPRWGQERRRAVPGPHLSPYAGELILDLGSTVELILMTGDTGELDPRMWVWKSWPLKLSAIGQLGQGRDTLLHSCSFPPKAGGRVSLRVMRLGELATFLTWCNPQGSRSFILPGLQGRAGPGCGRCRWATLRVVEWESWLSDQLRYPLGPDPGFWIALPQHLPHQWTDGVHGGTGSTDPNLYDLHDIRQQQDASEESQWNSRMDRIAEARGLIPDQQVIAMNIWEQRSVDKRAFCGTYCDTLELPQWEVFLGVGVGEGSARVEGGYEGRGR
jgi:hypothetical protein